MKITLEKLLPRKILNQFLSLNGFPGVTGFGGVLSEHSHLTTGVDCNLGCVHLWQTL